MRCEKFVFVDSARGMESPDSMNQDDSSDLTHGKLYLEVRKYFLMTHHSVFFSMFLSKLSTEVYEGIVPKV